MKSKHPRVHTLKDALAIILLFFILIFAIYQQMEFLSIGILIVLGAIIYKYRTRQIIGIGFDILKRTTTAKVGDVELIVKNDLGNMEDWIKTILSGLRQESFSLLLAIYLSGKIEVSDKNIEYFRELRSLGLIQSDSSHLSGSKEVWLSELGKNISENVLGKTKQD